jgi:DNA-directed RNA polymerase subunit L/DNA-directed RNA polymerase alpha subunit
MQSTKLPTSSTTAASAAASAAASSDSVHFKDIQTSADGRVYKFTLGSSHVTYANTLRRLVLTGVETVAFRADMTSAGTTTDVVVKQNDTPMTNEMLADRVGLLPIHVPRPLEWKDNKYLFTLNVAGEKDHTTYVKAGDFIVNEIPASSQPSESGDEKQEIPESEWVRVPTETFFPPNPITGDTCLIASLQPSFGSSVQHVEIVAKATKGTGREHARFCPVSQCSYEYSLDTDPQRIEAMFSRWLSVAKKVGALDKASDRYQELRREFETMEIKRCYLVNERGEPYSFDFTVETVGVLSVPYIIQRACEVGENMCSRYVNLETGDLPEEISISTANSRIVGYDFLIKGHDHTLGNLLQTWIVEHLIEGNSSLGVTYAGYSIPHPLRDEMVLRIGVRGGQESTARRAFAEAAKGCMKVFQELRSAWMAATGSNPATTRSVARRPLRQRPIVTPSAE